MKLKTIFHRAAAGALCLLLCVSSLAQTALASRVVSPETPIPNFNASTRCTLTLKYLDYPGVEFKVYRIAGIDSSVTYTPESLFNGLKLYPGGREVTLNAYLNSESIDWSYLAEYLKWHVQKQSYLQNRELAKLTGTLNTSDRGNIRGSDAAGSYVQMSLTKLDSGAALTPGLYLVVGGPYTVRTQGTNVDQTDTVTPMPYLVCLPNWLPDGNSANGYSWQYAVSSDIRGKVSHKFGSTQNLQVTKSWVNNGLTQPRSATVVLYKDGAPVDQVTLSAGTGWRYVWEGLEVGHTYWVEEINVPQGYIPITTDVNAYNWAISNVHNPYNPPGGSTPPTGGGGTYPPGTNPPGVTPRPTPDIPIDDPDVPLGNKTPRPDATPRPSDDEIELDDPDVPLGDLPQTGQLWWPVPLLAILGVFMLLVGIIRHRRGEYDDE